MLVSEGDVQRDRKTMERLEVIKQDIKFINNMLSHQGFDSAFPMASVVADLTDENSLTTGDIYALETATKILITLLNSKQVSIFISIRLILL